MNKSMNKINKKIKKDYFMVTVNRKDGIFIFVNKYLEKTQ